MWINRGLAISFSCPVLGFFNLQSLIDQNIFSKTITRHNLTHIPIGIWPCTDYITSWHLFLFTDKCRWKSLPCMLLRVLKAVMLAVYHTHACVYAQLPSCVWLFATPGTKAQLTFSVHGILQARMLEWFSIFYSRGSSWPTGWTWMSLVSPVLASSFFTTEPLGSPIPSIEPDL